MNAPEAPKAAPAAAGDWFRLSLPRGSVIFREGETGRVAYLIEEGVVEVVKATPSGELKLSELGKGELFGELAVIDASPRSATARARTDVVLRPIERAALIRHISTSPASALNLVARLSTYIRRLDLAASGSVVDAGRAEGRPHRRETLPPPAAEDIETLAERGPGLLLAGGSLALLGFAAAVLVWLGLSFVDQTVTARGKVTTRVPNVVVQATGNAVIEAFLVERGQQVAKGAVLARLDGTYVKANLAVVTGRLQAAEHRILRLQRERASTVDTGSAGGGDLLAGLDEVNRDILLRRIEEYRSRVAAFDADLVRIEREIASVDEEIVMAREQLDTREQIERARRQLYEKDVGSLIGYLDIKDARLAAQREVQALRNRVDNGRSALAAVQATRAAFIAEWNSKLAAQFAEQEELRHQLLEERTKLDRQTTDLAIRAPVDGLVLDLPRLGPGSIVAEGEPIVTLVRVNVPLALEIDVDARDVGDLRPGIPASVKLDSLPYQQYGDLPGTLAYVSGDSQEESLLGQPGTFYRARIRLEAESLPSFPPGYRLLPGMLATADLKLGERRLITYLLNPIARTLDTAFREPD